MLAYVGSKGTHLADVRDLNQTNPATGLAPYPQFSSILYVQSAAASSYNSLQFRSERRVGEGLTFLAAYTFSKSMDDVSAVFGGSVGSGLPQNSNDPQADRGPSDFNAKHRLVVSSVYDLPLGAQMDHASGMAQRPVGQLAGGRNSDGADWIALYREPGRRRNPDLPSPRSAILTGRTWFRSHTCRAR